MKNAWFLIVFILIGSCAKKKAEEKAFEPSTMNKFFEDYILNKDINVTLAKFQGRDTTSLLSDYTFKLIKNTYYDGPFEARKSGKLYTGTWQTNDDYSKLILKIPLSDTLNWISIDWKFKSKSLNSLELVPWFVSDGDRYVKFDK